MKAVTDTMYYNEIARAIQECTTDKSVIYKPSEMANGVRDSFATGEHQGYNEGYDVGFQKGHLDGEIAGYDNGLIVGEAQGKVAERDEFWEIFQKGGMIAKNMAYAFAYGRFNDTNYQPKYNIKVSGNSGYFMFAEAPITSTKVPIFIEGSDFRGAFRWDSGLTEIVELVVNDKTDLSESFHQCSGLEYIRFSGTIGSSVDFRHSTKLTKESMLGKDVALIEEDVPTTNLLTLNGITYYGGIFGALALPETDITGKTLTLSLTAVNKAFETSLDAKDGSTSVEWEMLTGMFPNWTISLMA